jgi:hypothetical protein
MCCKKVRNMCRRCLPSMLPLSTGRIITSIYFYLAQARGLGQSLWHSDTAKSCSSGLLTPWCKEWINTQSAEGRYRNVADMHSISIMFRTDLIIKHILLCDFVSIPPFLSPPLPAQSTAPHNPCLCPVSAQCVAPAVLEGQFYSPPPWRQSSS